MDDVGSDVFDHLRMHREIHAVNVNYKERVVTPVSKSRSSLPTLRGILSGVQQPVREQFPNHRILYQCRRSTVCKQFITTKVCTDTDQDNLGPILSSFYSRKWQLYFSESVSECVG